MDDILTEKDQRISMPKAQFDRIMETLKKAEEIIQSRGVVVVSYNRDADYYSRNFRHSDYLPRVVAVGDDQAAKIGEEMLEEMRGKFIQLEQELEYVQKMREENLESSIKYRTIADDLIEEIKGSFFTKTIKVSKYEKLLNR